MANGHSLCGQVVSARGATAAVLLICLLGCQSGDEATAQGVETVKTGPLRWFQRKWRSMAKYDWFASNSAPSGCPMELVDGDFIFPNQGSLYIPHKTLHYGWGKEISIHVVGPDTKSLPDRMNITFYSYLEDKFYQGSFRLPHARIADLFAEGFTYYPPKGTPERVTYNAIVAGVAPGGAVAVWVSGLTKQVEVFFGYAPEVKLDYRTIMRLPADIDAGEDKLEVVAEVASRDPLVQEMQKALPLGLWAAYRTRYLWQPVFEGLDPPKRFSRVIYLNGEREYLELPLDAAAQRTARAVPRYIECSGFETGRYRAFRVSFDEAEALAAFPRVGRGDTPIELVFRDGSEWDDSLVFVRNARESVRLEHVKIEKFARQ